MEDLFDRLQQHLPQRYLLERELKRGGMGTVYLAREQHPSRLVVIKVLHPHLTVHLGRERFLREIDLTSKLTHPHIVPIFAAGEAGMSGTPSTMLTSRMCSTGTSNRATSCCTRNMPSSRTSAFPEP
jgi:serine/threonine protein kinase